MGLDYSAPIPQPLIDSIPQPATATPTPVADMSNKGATTTRYALEDHTHKSSSQAKEMTVAAAGKFTWTFDQPFPVGTKPICTGTAKIASDATQGVIVNVVDGSETNEKVDYLVFQTKNTSTVGLNLTTILSLNILPVTLAANTVKVNVFARLPSTPTPT